MFGAAELLKKNEELEKANKDLQSKLSDLKKDYDRLKTDLEKEKGILLKTMELEFKQKMMDELAKVKEDYNSRLIKDMEGNFTNLKSSLSKLHEEGNANTRYLEKITLKMMDSMNVNMTNKRISHDDYSEM